MNYVYLKNTPVFTIKTYKGKNWVFWNATEKKMLKSETWIKDYKAQYQFELDNGDVLSLSKDQVGQMLVNCLETGKALSGASFEAKTNGKTGLDTRWYINLNNLPKRLENPTSVQPTSVQPNAEEAIDLNPLI